MPKQFLGATECNTAFQRASEKRRALIVRIKILKAKGQYDHEAVRLLLKVARDLSNARAKLLDNFFRSYYSEYGHGPAQQSHFIERKQGRVK